jgi:hypothetical protein
VIGGSAGLGRTEDRQAALPESIKRLRTGHFVNKVAVDVQNVGIAFLPIDNVAIPDFIK